MTDCSEEKEDKLEITGERLDRKKTTMHRAKERSHSTIENNVMQRFRTSAAYSEELMIMEIGSSRSRASRN